MLEFVAETLVQHWERLQQKSENFNFPLATSAAVKLELQDMIKWAAGTASGRLH